MLLTTMKATMMPKRVLCVEDEPDMIDLIRLIMTRKGYEFLSARGGRDGLRLAQTEQPSIILLDIMMPDMDGWTVYAHLKADPATARIPVIIVTARAKTDERLMALREQKVDDYITKPFGPSQLLESIARVLDRIEQP
jgi:CheY-like chemotaxis protein